MAKGIKTGGRTPGTPNKRTLEAIETLERLGCNPIEGMALIAMNDSYPVELRAKMLAELAPYIYPKRKAVDINNQKEGLVVVINRDNESIKYLPDQVLVDIIESKMTVNEYE